jgi:hemerythrin superfamily protein
MDAIQFLKHEHEHAKQTFTQIRAARGEQRGRLWTALKPELKVHEEMEEEALYGPIVDEAEADESLKEWDAHHQEEVAELEALVEEIDELDPAGEDWLEKLGELHETLEHHIAEEEGDIWPRIERLWDRARREQAGEQMEQIKRRTMGQAA